jgi:hypothetical protein
LIVGVAGAVGVSGRLDALDEALATRRSELVAITGDKAATKAVKRIDRGRAKLAKPSASVSLSREIVAASKVAGVIEKKLSDETALLSLLDSAIDAYRADLRSARSGLSAAAAKGPNYSKLLKQTDKALLQSEVGKTRAARLLALSKVAKLTHGFELTGVEATWVVGALQLAPGGTGVDLNGDGHADNAIGGARATLESFGDGLDIDAALADALAQAGTQIVLQMWGIDDYQTDPRVFAAALLGQDLDGDASDNLSGSEVFDVTASVDPVDGYGAVRASTEFAGGGAFEASFGGAGFAFGDFMLEGDNRLVVEGVASLDSNTGYLGFAIPLTQVRALLEASGVTVTPLIAFGLALLTDIDLDGNGMNDAMSISLAYDAVPCGVTVAE